MAVRIGKQLVCLWKIFEFNLKGLQILKLSTEHFHLVCSSIGFTEIRPEDGFQKWEPGAQRQPWFGMIVLLQLEILGLPSAGIKNHHIIRSLYLNIPGKH